MNCVDLKKATTTILSASMDKSMVLWTFDDNQKMFIDKVNSTRHCSEVTLEHSSPSGPCWWNWWQYTRLLRMCIQSMRFIHSRSRLRRCSSSMEDRRGTSPLFFLWNETFPRRATIGSISFPKWSMVAISTRSKIVLGIDTVDDICWASPLIKRHVYMLNGNAMRSVVRLAHRWSSLLSLSVAFLAWNRSSSDSRLRDEMSSIYRCQPATFRLWGRWEDLAYFRCAEERPGEFCANHQNQRGRRYSSDWSLFFLANGTSVIWMFREHKHCPKVPMYQLSVSRTKRSSTTRTMQQRQASQRKTIQWPSMDCTKKDFSNRSSSTVSSISKADKERISRAVFRTPIRRTSSAEYALAGSTEAVRAWLRDYVGSIESIRLDHRFIVQSKFCITRSADL